MNIIDAVKSGKPYKRKLAEGWIVPKSSSIITISQEDLLADDWEVEEKKVDVTASMINDIFDKNDWITTFGGLRIELLNKLGLK